MTMIELDVLSSKCRELGVPCEHLGHESEGMEEVALQPLHSFCVSNPRAPVAYIHNKGSYHPTPEQQKMRQFLVGGISSEACVEAITTGGSCDTCSSRFCPIPHQHTSGNMWLAKCDYVSNLIAPREFPAVMGRYVDSYQCPQIKRLSPYYIGLERMALEHWIGAHPSLGARARGLAARLAPTPTYHASTALATTTFRPEGGAQLRNSSAGVVRE
jgi:hypothetical protein